MKVPSAVACLTLLSPIVLGAPSLNLWKDQSPIQIDGDIPVPGDNPLTYCAAPSSNILTIERVDLSPNPPLP